MDAVVLPDFTQIRCSTRRPCHPVYAKSFEPFGEWLRAILELRRRNVQVQNVFTAMVSSNCSIQNRPFRLCNKTCECHKRNRDVFTFVCIPDVQLDSVLLFVRQIDPVVVMHAYCDRGIPSERPRTPFRGEGFSNVKTADSA